MNFLQGHSGTKVQCEACLFSQGKTPEFTKMGEIHELFVLPFLWFGLLGRLLIPGREARHALNPHLLHPICGTPMRVRARGMDPLYGLDRKKSNNQIRSTLRIF